MAARRFTNAAAISAMHRAAPHPGEDPTAMAQVHRALRVPAAATVVEAGFDSCDEAHAQLSIRMGGARSESNRRWHRRYSGDADAPPIPSALPPPLTLSWAAYSGSPCNPDHSAPVPAAAPLLLVPSTSAAHREAAWRLTCLSEAPLTLQVLPSGHCDLKQDAWHGGTRTIGASI